MLTDDCINPSKPRVMMMGATLEIGPEALCFINVRTNINSIKAANRAPPSMATGSAIQKELKRAKASYPK